MSDFIGLDVLLEKRRVPTDDAQADIAVGIAAGLARAIKRRVRKEGKPVDPFHGYQEQEVASYQRKKRRLISPRYPVTGGKVDERTGLRIFDSSADFHRAAGTRDGTFDVSGGMWEGLSVVPLSSGARIAFRGRSEGQSFRVRRYKSGTVRINGFKVSNALKGGSILKSLRINVLQPSDEEVASVAEAVVLVVSRSVDLAMAGAVRWSGPESQGFGPVTAGMVKAIEAKSAAVN